MDLLSKVSIQVLFCNGLVFALGEMHLDKRLDMVLVTVITLRTLLVITHRPPR